MGQVHVGPVPPTLVSVDSYTPCLVDSDDCILQCPPYSLVLTISSTGFPDFLEDGFDGDITFKLSICIMSQCGSLCLFTSSVWFYLTMSLGSLISGFCLF